MNVREAAKAWGVSENVVRKLIRSGRVEAEITPTGYIIPDGTKRPEKGKTGIKVEGCEDMMTVNEAAEAWGISPITVRMYIQQGRLQAEELQGVGRTVYMIPAGTQKPARKPRA